MVAMDNEVAGRELQDERLARGVAAGGPTRTASRGGYRASRAPREHRTASLDGAEQLAVRVHMH